MIPKQAPVYRQNLRQIRITSSTSTRSTGLEPGNAASAFFTPCITQHSLGAPAVGLGCGRACPGSPERRRGHVGSGRACVPPGDARRGDLVVRGVDALRVERRQRVCPPANRFSGVETHYRVLTAGGGAKRRLGQMLVILNRGELKGDF